MHDSNSDLLDRLRSLISQLGTDGGLISPSVYDTAQVLRLYPPVEGVVRGLEWLLEQQQVDGGWGVLTVPAARDIPTLAAVLALYSYRHIVEAGDRIQAGIDFLRQQANQWMSIHIDLIPIAGEMILPYLLEEAEQIGLSIDQSPYARIFELRRMKLNYLDGQLLPTNSSPTYSWDALGFPHRTEVLHDRTGVGHSPAATAAWLHTARQIGEDPILCAKAEDYLSRASATTNTGVPGVMPMVYPITGFELCYGLYALLLTGLLDHPELRDVVIPKVAKLRDMLEREQGLSMGERFVPDVDDTSVAVAVLQAIKQPADIALVRRFWRKDHFYTFVHELNPSVFSNAHALHALVLSGERCESTEDYLIRQQTESGAWVVDKWHTSWRSSTLEVVASLLRLGYEEQLCQAGQALINDQNLDGSWGVPDGAVMLETTYSVIALQLIASNPQLTQTMQPALDRGWQWLWEHREDLHILERTWLGKEVYSAVRVDEVYRLCAVLSPLLHRHHPMVEQPAAASLLAMSISEEY